VDVEATSGEIMVTVALGGGGGDKFALGGSVAVSVADGSITAQAVGGSTIDATGNSGDVTIAASDDTMVVTVAGGFAGSGTAGVGIAASTTNVLNTTEAVVDDSKITSDHGDIDVTAGFVPSKSSSLSSLNLKNAPITLPSVDSSQIYDLAVGGAGAGKVAVGLAITVNTVTNTVKALVRNGSTVTADGAVLIGAYDQSTINTLALGAAGAGNVAVGGAIAANVIANTIESDIDDSTVIAGTTFELDAETTAIIRALGIGASGSGTVAVSVSALGNAVANTISALITNGSTVKSGGNATITASELAPSVIPTWVIPSDQQAALTSSLSYSPIDLTADILAVNVSVAGSGTVAVAAAVTGNVIHNTIKADITGSTVLAGVTAGSGDAYTVTNSSAAVSLTSKSEDKIISVTAGVGASGTVGVSALLFGNVITSSIESEITDSTVRSGGAMQLKASDDSSIRSVGLSIAASGTVSVGAIVAANVVTNTVKTEIAGSTVTSGSSLDVTALNDSTIYGFTTQVSGSGVVGVGVVFAANVIANTTDAEILNYGATASNVTTAGALTISATDQSTIDAFAFSVAGSGTVAVGVGLSANVIANTVHAGIEGGSTITSGSTIDISALSEPIIGRRGGPGLGHGQRDRQHRYSGHNG
jgi:hypothetical protein